MLKPTRILVPTDFSEFSDKALKQALDIAKQYGAKVFLFHVIHEELHQCVVDYCLTDAQLQALRDEMIRVARLGLARQVEKFPLARELEVTTDVNLGIPYEAILKEAEERKIDLIVIASLGRTGLAKYIIGSVSRNVLKGAKCPVLLTK